MRELDPMELTPWYVLSHQKISCVALNVFGVAVCFLKRSNLLPDRYQRGQMTGKNTKHFELLSSCKMPIRVRSRVS
jgi:hypothetical protein